MQNAKKITSILLVVSVTMALFVGCGSKTADTSAKAATTSTQTSKKKFNPTAMKILYSDTLKSLVTDKTITQDQSDKVLAEVTKNVPTGTKPANGTKTTGTDKTNDTRPKNNQLSALVTSSVITQAQADTISQKIQEARKSAQGTTTK